MLGFAFSYFLHETTELGWREIIGTSTVIAVVIFIARAGPAGVTALVVERWPPR